MKQKWNDWADSLTDEESNFNIQNVKSKINEFNFDDVVQTWVNVGLIQSKDLMT